jgi:hypothetical protein
MPILKTGQQFSSGDQVTSQKLMDIADLATFEEPADGSTIIVNNEFYNNGQNNGDGKLKVPANGITGNELLQDATDDNNRAVTTDHIKDLNITTEKIANDAVTSDKLEHINNLNVLGNVSGSVAAPVPVEIKDEDDMGGESSSNIALVTQQSIKAYVDNSIPDTSQLLKAKCTFDGTDTNPTVNDGFNVLSITKNADGDYTVTFDNAITNPVASVTALQAQNTNTMDASIYSINQSTVRIITGTNTSGRDDVTVHLIVF